MSDDKQPTPPFVVGDLVCFTNMEDCHLDTVPTALGAKAGVPYKVISMDYYQDLRLLPTDHLGVWAVGVLCGDKPTPRYFSAHRFALWDPDPYLLPEPERLMALHEAADLVASLEASNVKF